MKNYKQIFINGLAKENPLLILNIGLCSSLAVTTTVVNGIGMGIAMSFVLIMSEIIISAFRKHIPDSIRIPIFIIVIAAFTTIIQLVLAAFQPDLSEALGVFLPLIVVNCIIMGRVESFASKEKVGAAFFDGLGMSIGYTWVLVAISFIRELLGAGTLLGFKIIPKAYTIGLFSKAPGGFIVFGFLIAILLGIRNRKPKIKQTSVKKIEGGDL